MNYQKKRMRQAGRQARQHQTTYRIYIDDQCKVHSKLVKPTKPRKDDLIE